MDNQGGAGLTACRHAVRSLRTFLSHWIVITSLGSYAWTAADGLHCRPSLQDEGNMIARSSVRSQTGSRFALDYRTLACSFHELPYHRRMSTARRSRYNRLFYPQRLYVYTQAWFPQLCYHLTLLLIKGSDLRISDGFPKGGSRY